MKSYFISGNILYGNGEVPKLKVGDLICYDRVNIDNNGRFSTLHEFRDWLNLHFEFEHLVGEEYSSGTCSYTILGFRNAEYPVFKTQIFNNSSESYSRLLHL